MSRSLLVAPLCAMLCACASHGPAAPDPAPFADPQGIMLHYEWEGNVEGSGFREPSGVTWHAGRGTLFVVGDEGELCELTTTGEKLQHVMLREGADLEGVSSDPATGLLYVVVEGEERVLEVEPDGLAMLREFQVPREAGGEELLKPGGQGIEAVCFVPDAGHPEGGTFFVANQSFAEGPGMERSLVLEVELPLRSGGTEPVRIVNWFAPGVVDISGLHYDAESGDLLMVSDAANMLLRTTRDGQVLRVWAFTGDSQEGIAIDDQGWMYIAQDSGGVVKIKPAWE